MNLGSIKDKTGKSILRKKTVKKAFTLLAVCCVAVIAVTAAVSLTNSSNQTPVLEAPENTSSQASNGNASVFTPKPSVTSPAPSPTSSAENTDSPVSSGTTVTKTMLMPVTEGNVIKGYASDTLVYSSTLDHWSTHTALDISAPEGTTVLCALEGTVLSVKEDELMGLTVTISHTDGIETVYSALESVTEEITEGANILQGQAIGAMGNSASSESSDGAHLHFEVKKDGKSVNPQNYLSGSKK